MLVGSPGRFAGRLARVRTGRADARFQSELRFDAHAPELILSPHWDDAALNCWGLLSDRERELRVMNVFAGIPGSGTATTWDAILGVRDSAERARVRAAEDERALSRASRSAIDLPLLESRLRGRAGAPALADLDRAIAREARAASHVYAPAGIGGHLDHVLVRRYALALARHEIPVSLYAEMPYCVFHGWPEWVDEREPARRRNAEAWWASFLDGVPGMPALSAATVTHLDGARAQDKQTAIEGYEASLNYGIRRMLADPYFHASEIRWELNAGRARDADGPAR
jgi:LmbE family N-acetylglucosaminyl deacetylase